MARVHIRGFYGLLAGLILAAGSAFAQPISQLPNKGVVAGDAAAVVGGDEFVIYCPACPVHPIYSRNRAVASSAVGDFITNIVLSALGVKELDGSPLVTPLDTVIFDQTDGFVVTDAGSQDARVDWGIPDLDFGDFTCVAGVCTLDPGSVSDIWLDEAGDTFTGPIQAADAAGPVLVNEAASSTNPTLIPDRASLDDGIGHSGSGVTVVEAGTPVMSFSAGSALVEPGTFLSFAESVGVHKLRFDAPADITSTETCLFTDQSNFITSTCLDPPGSSEELVLNQAGNLGADPDLTYDGHGLNVEESRSANDVYLYVSNTENTDPLSTADVFVKAGDAAESCLHLYDQTAYRSEACSTTSDDFVVRVGGAPLIGGFKGVLKDALLLSATGASFYVAGTQTLGIGAGGISLGESDSGGGVVSLLDAPWSIRFYEDDSSISGGGNYVQFTGPNNITAGNHTCLLTGASDRFIPASCVEDNFSGSAGAITLAGDVDGPGSTNDLDEAAVEPELEGVMDLQDMQGAVTDAQVPNTITVDLAAAATALAANGANCSAGSYARGVDASGAAEDCTVDSTTPASNALTLTKIIPLLPATCQNTTAYLSWSHETTNFPAATCVTGTNTQKAFAAFDQTTDECLQTSIPLRSNWTGAVDAYYKWNTSATSGSVAWCTQVICVADGETGDPAYPAQASGNCVTDTAKGTTLQYNDISDTSITITGCAASEEMYVRLCRDPNETGGQTDTVAADANLIDMYLILRETQPE